LIEQVVYGSEQSVTSAMLLGVPKGAVLGPMLYTFFTAPLFDIITQHRVNAHQNTDDLQLHLCMPPMEARRAAPMCISLTSKPG